MRRAIACCVVLATAMIAHADEPAEKAKARSLLQRGNALYASGDFKGALQLFRQAYDFFPSRKLLMNTAACEKELGRRDHAASDIAEFLRQHDRDRSPPPEEGTLVEQARLELDVLTPDLGYVIVEGVARDAIVEIDNEETWRRSYVDPGEHTVRLREPGQPTFETRIKAVAGKTSNVRRGAAAPAAVAETPVAVVETPRPRDTAPKKPRPAWVVPVAVVGGIVVVGVALGIGLGVGLHHSQPLSGELGTVPFNPK
jgi:hypothetical protein